MKAVWITELGKLEQAGLAEVQDPEPGPGEVVLEVRAAEVNYPDMMVVEGTYQNRPPLPFSPGKGAAGRVLALGAGVSGLAVGERIATQVEYGAYAQRLRAPACNCFPLPASIDFPTAAALGLAYQTAWFALVERARLQPGETVLVLGASGGVGVAAVQLAKALGAGAVIAAVRAEADAAVARAAGADGVVLVGGGQPVREPLREQVASLLGGRGADVVVDPVGGEIGTAALRTLAWCGRLVVIGFAAGAPPEVRANYLLVKNIAVLGLHWSDYRDRTPERVAEAQRAIFAFHEAGRLNPVIEAVLPMSRVRDALRALRDGTVQGKLVLDPSM